MNKGLLFVAAVVVGFISQQALRKLTEDKRTDREKIRDIHERRKAKREKFNKVIRPLFD